MSHRRSYVDRGSSAYGIGVKEEKMPAIVILLLGLLAAGIILLSAAQPSMSPSKKKINSVL